MFPTLLANNLERTLFVVASLLCVTPVWIAPYPPMADLPQHAAQIALWFNLQDPTFAFRELFETHLFTPYLLGYALIAALTPLFGVLVACKLVISVALAAFAGSTRIFLRAAGADPYWAWLAIPVLYGFCYQWGFISYLIAAPVGLLFLARAWRHDANAGWRAGLVLALLLLFLFFSHALILALFGGIAAAVWLARHPRPREFARVAWPLLAPAPFALLWLAAARAHPFSQFTVEWDLSWWNTIDSYYVFLASWATPNDPGWGRVTGFFPRLLGLRPDVITTTLGITLFALPFLARARPNPGQQRWIPFALVTAVLLLAPSLIHGVAFVFQRYTFLTLPFFLLLFVPASAHHTPAQRAARAAAPVIAFAWIAWMTHTAADFAQDAQGFDTVLEHIEPERRVLAFTFERDDRHSIAPVLVHHVAWYSALKRGVVDPSFARTQIQPVTYRAEHAPTATVLGFEWFPQKFDWTRHGGKLYDYYIARAPSDPGMLLFRDATCTITLAAQAGHWWLYRRDPIC